jgi:hypothetical protein
MSGIGQGQPTDRGNAIEFNILQQTPHETMPHEWVDSVSGGDVPAKTNRILSRHDLEELRRPGSWMTDSLIQYAVTEYPPGYEADGADVLWIPPAIVEAGRGNDRRFADTLGSAMADELYSFWDQEETELSKSVVLFPINSGGNHWSLLAFSADSHAFVHYDSLGGHNTGAAREVIAAMHGAGFLTTDKIAIETPAWIRRQSDGFNCGVYVMQFARQMIASGAVVDAGAGAGVTSASCDDFRNDLLEHLRPKFTPEEEDEQEAPRKPVPIASSPVVDDELPPPIIVAATEKKEESVAVTPVIVAPARKVTFEYPSKIVFVDFAGALVPPDPPFKRRLSASRSHSDATNTNSTDTIFCSVEKLWLKTALKTQPDDQSRCAEHEEIPPSADERFFFAPGEEDVEVFWELSRPELISVLKLELFHRGRDTAIWTKTMRWPRGSCPKQGSTPFNGDLRTIEKLMAASEATEVVIDSIPGEAFPDGFVTIEHSPYKLRLTIDPTPGVQRRVPSRWVYFDVLVHSLELKWGAEGADDTFKLLTRERSDIDQGYLDKVHDYEHAMLGELIKANADPIEKVTHKVVLPSNLFAIRLPTEAYTTESYETNRDFLEYKKLWGDGPRIPLRAVIRIRKSDRSGTEKAPQAIGNTRVLWDWADDVADRWKEPMSAGSAPKTEAFIDAAHHGHNADALPKGSHNCPADLGGKRGDPAGAIFPEQKDPRLFPWRVERCENRRWASLARFGNTPETRSTAGAILQPSRMAGDTCSVRAILYFDRTMDSEGEIEAPKPVQTHTATFKVFRRVTVNYMVRGGAAELGCDPAELQKGLKEHYLRELDIEVDLQEHAVDNEIYKRAIRNAIESGAKTARYYSGFPGLPLILRTLVDTNPAATSPGVCYHTRDQFGQNVLALFKASKMRRLDDIANFDVMLFEEFKAVGNGVKGMLLKLRKDPVAFPPLVMIAANDELMADDSIVGNASRVKARIVVDYTPNCWGHRFVKGVARPTDAAYASVIVVNFPGGSSVRISYKKVGVTRELSTELSDRAKRDLKQGLVAAAKGFDKDASFDIQIEGRDNSDNAKERRKNVEEYLDPLFYSVVIDRKFVWEQMEYGRDLGWEFTDPGSFNRACRKSLADVVLLEQIIAEYVKLKHADDEGIFMMHIPGENNAHDLPGVKVGHQPPKLTGAFYGTATGERNRAVVYLATVADDIASKGETKSIPAVFNHEIAHALFIPHALQVTGNDPGTTHPECHVAEDNCLMNYDVDSDHFCGYCMLRLRGWNWKTVPNTLGTLEYQIQLELGDPNDLFDTPSLKRAGKKTRLQVLGLLNRPLDHPQAEGCFDFSWRHTVGLFSDLRDASEPVIDTVLAREIGRFLVQEGKLPEKGEFAKIRVPGGHMPMYAQSTLMAMFPGDAEYSDEAKPYNDYQLASNRFEVEQSYYDVNPALGKIPLRIRVQSRPLGSSAAWTDAPGVKVWIQLVKPDPLPAYAAPGNPEEGKHPVAGGFSFHKQVAPPGMLEPTAKWVKANIVETSPGDAADPQFGNVSKALAGVHDPSAHNGLFLEPASKGMTRLPAVPVGTDGRIVVTDKGKKRMVVKADKETVVAVTDANGLASVLFSPSRIGGDRYRLRALVAPQKPGGDTQPSGISVVETGTLVRWRAIRICRQLFMPPPADAGEMPPYLRLPDGTLPKAIETYNCRPLDEFDVKGRMTLELGRAYCELIVEPKALKRESIEPFGKDIVAKAKELVTAFPAFNSAKDSVKNPHRHQLILDPGDLTRTHYSVTLPSKVSPGGVTVRPRGGNLASVIAMDDRGTFDDLGKIPMAQPPTIDYVTGRVEVVFAAAQGAREFEVCYFPDDYIDLDKLLVFPKKSPFMFNLRLPHDYNNGLAPTRKKMPVTVGDPLARPQEAFEFIDSQSKGLVKGLLMQSAVLAIENNNGFYPGLLLLQADVLDNYYQLWPTGTQGGKGVGGGVYVFGTADAQRLMVHESGHGLYLEHAKTAPGYKKDLHVDDDTCVMSYSDCDEDYCGKCNASLRGVNIVGRPARRKQAAVVPLARSIASPERVICGAKEIMLASVTTGAMSDLSFHSDTVPVPTLADDAVKRFCFAPVHEEVWIAWAHTEPENVARSVVEIFCTIKGARKSIWKKTFTWDNCPAEAETRFDGNLAYINEAEDRKRNPGLRSVELEFSKSRFPEDFPDGCVTIMNSPYEVRMTVISKDGSKPAPEATWLYFDIVVHEITLAWGPEAVLDRTRADVVDPYKPRLIKREKKILSDLVAGVSLVDDGTGGGIGHDVVINVSMFNKSNTSWLHQMYGNGPRIPITARALVRTSRRNEGADAILALGRAQFMWEWSDNQAETLDDRVERWLGDKALATNPVSGITRNFIEEFFKGNQSADFPNHAYNASVKAGGKRGIARPKPAASEGVKGRPAPGPVFMPDTTSADHWETIPCTKRDWAVMTPAKAGQTIDAHSMVLFQPSTIGGDTYRISVSLAYEKNRDGTYLIDNDKQGGQYYDLPADLHGRGVAVASTRFFTIWRKINAIWYFAPAFAGTENATVAALQAQMKRELGVMVDIQQNPFPNMRGHLDAAVEHVIRTRLVTTGGALLLRSAIPIVPLPLDLDYALDVNPPHQAFVDLMTLFRSNPLYLVKSTADMAGHEVHGGTSTAIGVSLVKPPKMYSSIDAEIVLSLNNTLFQAGEPIEGWATPGIMGTVTTCAAPDLLCWELTVTPVTQNTLSARAIKLMVPALNLETTIRFTEGTFRAKRSLSDTITGEIETFLALVAANVGHHDDQDLTINVVGKRSDAREIERATNVETFIRQNVVSRKLLFDIFAKAFLDHGKKTEEEQYATNAKTEVDWVFKRCFDLQIEAMPNLDALKEEGCVFFYHLRGNTVWNTFATGGNDAGRSTEQIGYTFVLEPPAGANRRQIKDLTAVMVHEFGHALFLAHAAPRLFETKPAGGAFAAHLAHDTCIMNYDVDSEAFCAGCILERRGFAWKGVVPVIGDSASAPWRDTCEQIMNAEIATHPTELGRQVRLAMFMLSAKNDIPAATALMAQAAVGLAGLPVDEQVWLLRNLIVFYNRIEGNNNTSVTARGYLLQLLALTTQPFDVADLTAANLLKVNNGYVGWKNAD